MRKHFETDLSRMCNFRFSIAYYTNHFIMKIILAISHVQMFKFTFQTFDIFTMLSTQRDIVYFLKSHCKQMLYHRVRMRQIIHVYFNNNHDKTHFNNNQSNTFVLFFVLFFSLFFLLFKQLPIMFIKHSHLHTIVDKYY